MYGADITTVVQAEAEIINTQKEVVYAMGEIGETRSKEICNHEVYALIKQKQSIKFSNRVILTGHSTKFGIRMTF